MKKILIVLIGALFILSACEPLENITPADINIETEETGLTESPEAENG